MSTPPCFRRPSCPGHVCCGPRLAPSPASGTGGPAAPAVETEKLGDAPPGPAVLTTWPTMLVKQVLRSPQDLAVAGPHRHKVMEGETGLCHGDTAQLGHRKLLHCLATCQDAAFAMPNTSIRTSRAWPEQRRSARAEWQARCALHQLWHYGCCKGDPGAGLLAHAQRWLAHVRAVGSWLGETRALPRCAWTVRPPRGSRAQLVTRMSGSIRRCRILKALLGGAWTDQTQSHRR